MGIDYRIYDMDAGLDPRIQSDFSSSPAGHGNTYGDDKYFDFVGTSNDGGVMIAWQDQTTDAGYITTLKESTQTSVSLPIDSGHWLGCATAGDSGEIFYITFEKNTNRDDKESSV